jgi:nicotinamidase-related amidase
MSVTTLDRQTALSVIDLQKGIIARPTVHPAAKFVERAAALTPAFRRHGLPVVLVNVDGGAPGRTEQGENRIQFPAGWAELIPDLKQRFEDYTVTKRKWGAFTHTGLEAHLRKLAVTQVVIAGIATSIGIESTARHAHELGFNVTFAIDAMTDMNAEAHIKSIARIFPRLGETGTSEKIEILDHARA